MLLFLLGVLGLALGSFVNALTWRLYEQNRAEKDGIKPEDLSIWKGRSMCPSCHHRLASKDLMPVFSWLALKGRCRYCRKKISWQYPAVELLTAGLFIFSYYFWPLQFKGVEDIMFALWLAILVLFIALAIYDLRWRLLPNKLVWPLMVLCLASLVVSIIKTPGEAGRLILGAFWGLLLLAGVFYVLFQLSGGKWIGGGDVKLGLALGILVGGPLNSILVLLLASTAGTLYSLPFVLTGKAGRRTQIPFGPFLILAAVITNLFGASVISWYKGLYF